MKNDILVYDKGCINCEKLLKCPGHPANNNGECVCFEPHFKEEKEDDKRGELPGRQ